MVNCSTCMFEHSKERKQIYLFRGGLFILNMRMHRTLYTFLSTGNFLLKIFFPYFLGWLLHPETQTDMQKTYRVQEDANLEPFCFHWSIAVS